MREAMRPVYWFWLSVSGVCGPLLWYFLFVPPKRAGSWRARLQTMIRSDAGWRVLLSAGLVLAAGMFLFSLLGLLAAA